MKQEELFTLAMGLQDPWFIERVEFEQTQKRTLINELHLYVGHKPLHKFKGEDANHR